VSEHPGRTARDVFVNANLTGWLAGRVEVNRQCERRYTPLMTQVRIEAPVEVIRAMLDAGAGPVAGDTDRYQTLRRMIDKSQRDDLEFLRAATSGPDASSRSDI
jgi:hypothetical protein